jgi:hypothetical protein
MIYRLAIAVAVALAAMTAALVSPSTASAHDPRIVAEIVCDEATGAMTINYTATAWEGLGSDPTNDPSRANSQIDIRLDGVTVASGAFTAPGYAFSGSIPVPAGKVAGDIIEVSALAVADWGNGSPGGLSNWFDVVVPEGCGDALGTGRFTGGGHQIRVGAARVTRGLTIHCDLLLSNNLEVNWGGNKFHMTEHLETVECSDSPDIIQFPPAAPLDTLIGVGTGRYNGTDGYTIEFTLVDYGEPGSSDRMAIKIYRTANPADVALNVPLQVLSGGNLQAHYDQPHK